MAEGDIIKMNTNNILKDSNGKPIPINVQKPEYITETFNFKPGKSEIHRGDE